MFVKCALFAMFFLNSQFAISQIYKCKDARGKVIYSEESCSLGTKGVELDVEPNVMDSSAIRRQIASKKVYKQVPVEDQIAAGNLMNSYDKELRLRELNIDIKNDQATWERKADAKNEFNYLNISQVYSLSYENELKRRNLKVDLESYDKPKRANALRLLHEIYVKYQSPS